MLCFHFIKTLETVVNEHSPFGWPPAICPIANCFKLVQLILGYCDFYVMTYLFIYLEFCVAFNSVQVIS